MTWLDSADRERELEKGEKYFTIDQRLQLTGLEFWFDKAPPGKPPKKWKMLVLTITTIFILLNTLIPLCHKLFRLLCLPEIVISLLSVSMMVALMTYYVMPAVTKAFSAWLSPSSSPPGHKGPRN
jgi:antibiotic biosynthesis monooxygenase (ABM) superfamily enzyme